ncbi:hypothetical protein, conserved [Trypanosoma brucei brucei TREU927]|uniref:Transmembrane protein n=1 Tax=Trypanosoma brucei brucei (strain 927/4 GUTat10.1) TaxID=185431 RepID=Q382G6_TRYB2|nr:hypothetical protein, conserved [Trypanosoma brucei brucei TREU927]EAN80315.1 hypothetical protein, conserved [Trypanosoma brucei brucei TREU927]
MCYHHDACFLVIGNIFLFFLLPLSRSTMGHLQSTQKQEPNEISSEGRVATEHESTNIDDLIRSGRYKVAKKETLEMMSAIQDERDRGKLYPDSEVKDLKQYIIEQEGLNVGDAKRRALSQQWRFFLSCEPMQRGLDAGIIVGSFAAAVYAFRSPKNRIPAKVGLVFACGCCLGLITVPVLVVAAESYNNKRIKKLEKELFAKQRAEFLNKER